MYKIFLSNIMIYVTGQNLYYVMTADYRYYRTGNNNNIKMWAKINRTETRIRPFFLDIFGKQ